MNVSFSPDIILYGWLGLKHQLTNAYVVINDVATKCQDEFIEN